MLGGQTVNIENCLDSDQKDKTDSRAWRKILEGKANNLTILQQDVPLLSTFSQFLNILHDKFFYQKSDIRICECCECLNPPLFSDIAI